MKSIAKFRKIVKENMSNYRIQRLGFKENEKGTYNKNLYGHILPDPDSNKLLNLIGEDLQNEIQKEVGAKGIKLHSFFHHLTSSQALAFNLLYPFIGYGHDSKDHFKPMERPDKLGDILHVELSDKAKARFEYVADTKEQTNYDFYIKDGNKEFTFELKYTEGSLCTKSSSSQDDKRWNDIYREPMNTILIDSENAAGIFFSAYQLWRNIINIYNDRKEVFFIVPEEREDLIGEIEAARRLVKDRYKKKIHTVTIEQICKKGKEFAPDHYNYFKEKYLPESLYQK